MRLNSISTLLIAGALSAFGTTTAVAQGPVGTASFWQYNPDANGNGNIATYDLVELLSMFGQDVEFPEVVPAETVDGLTAQVEWLEQVVEVQHQQLTLLSLAVQQLQHQVVSPFTWSEEKQAWVCGESLVIDGVVRSGRMESGSARIGGLSAN
jgi:hypothetical protein